MTREKIFVICAFIIFQDKSFSQLSYNDSVAYSAQILNIEQQLMDAIPAADTALWSRYLHENFFIVTEDGTAYNKKDFLKTFSPLPKGYSGYIKVIKPHIVFKNNTAVIQYVSDEYETVFGQQLHTTYASADTYIKTGTAWKMIASQVFEIPQLPPAIKISLSILKNYTGTYQLNDTIKCTISLSNDSLFIQKKGRKKEVLLAETENIFFRQSDTRGRKVFVKNEEGIMLMLERRNGEDVVWKRNEK